MAICIGYAGYAILVSSDWVCCIFVGFWTHLELRSCYHSSINGIFNICISYRTEMCESWIFDTAVTAFQHRRLPLPSYKYSISTMSWISIRPTLHTSSGRTIVCTQNIKLIFLVNSWYSGLFKCCKMHENCKQNTKNLLATLPPDPAGRLQSPGTPEMIPTFENS